MLVIQRCPLIILPHLEIRFTGGILNRAETGHLLDSRSPAFPK